MIIQAVRSFGKSGKKLGLIAAVGNGKIGYSFAKGSNIAQSMSELAAHHYGFNCFDETLARRIAIGRANSERKKFSLEQFVKDAGNNITPEYVEFCNKTLLAKLYEKNDSRKTVRSIINNEIVYNEEGQKMLVTTDNSLYCDDDNVGMTAAETLYPYLVVMNDRMVRYYK